MDVQQVGRKSKGWWRQHEKASKKKTEMTLYNSSYFSFQYLKEEKKEKDYTFHSKCCRMDTQKPKKYDQTMVSF